MASGRRRLDVLPDVVILKVLEFLSTGDICVIAQVNDRLKRLCRSRSLIRNSSFEGGYFVKDDELRQFISSNCDNIQRLNLNHCYWYPQRTIQWTIGKCKNLRALHVIECRLRTEAFVNLVASSPQLEALSMSISSFADIKKDVFAPAKETLKNLKMLGVFYTSRELSVMSYLGQHATMLDYCTGLEELYIGSAGMAIPELYRPLISDPQNHQNLKVMCITNNIHAGAQMLFYGTLSQLPNEKIHWQTLLMPNVNFTEFIKKSDFKGCLQNMKQLKNLDISGSRVKFPIELLDMPRALDLQHLCLSNNLVTSNDLKYIATSCPKLTSINLFCCSSIFKEDNEFDFEGFISLFAHCVNLEHLNIAGEHHHINADPDRAEEMRNALERIKGLLRLAVPACLLHETDYGETSPRRRGHRFMSSRSSRGVAPKRRCADGHVAVPVSSSPDRRDSSPQPGTSYSGGSSGQAGGQRREPLLAMLAKHNPDLRELEVVSENFTSVFQKNKFVNAKLPQFSPCAETRSVKDSAVEPISRMTQLRRLALIGLSGLSSGNCLVSIAQGCQRLQYLSVGFLGAGLYGNTFARSLRYMQELQDLRIEQPNLTLNAALFEGLASCPKLQRLCIIARHSTFQHQDITRLMEQCHCLVVLQLYAGGTITACKTLTTALNKRYSKSRPALSVSIYPVMCDGIAEVSNNIPAKHFDELTRFHSFVCATPPDIKW